MTKPTDDAVSAKSPAGAVALGRCTLRIAVIGAGMIGQLRAQSVIRNPNTKLSAVVDVDRDAAARAAGGSGARVETAYEAVLDGADAVIIASPVTLHEEMCQAAFQADCHVLVEKPLSNTVESCRTVLQGAASAGKALAVGFNHRYYPAMKYVKQVLEEGRIGTVDEVRIFGGHDGLANFRADWMYKGALSGGGAMMDVGLHMTDLARFFMGEIDEVYGVTGGRVWNVENSEDRALVIFKGASGVPAIYEATWNEWQGYEVSVEVYGDRGMVRGAYAPMMNLLITQAKPGAPRKTEHRRYLGLKVKEKLRGWQSTTLQTFEDELADFLRMIEGQDVPLADGLDGLRAVAIAQAVYESSSTGSAVQVKDELSD